VKTGNLVAPDAGIASAKREAGAHREGSVRQYIADRGGGPIVVIDRCEPARSYLVRCLQEVTGGTNIVAFANVHQWFQVAEGYRRPKIILICNADREDEGDTHEFSSSENFADVPVFLVPNIDGT